jgi:hypothetical protein
MVFDETISSEILFGLPSLEVLSYHGPSISKLSM